MDVEANRNSSKISRCWRRMSNVERFLIIAIPICILIKLVVSIDFTSDDLPERRGRNYTVCQSEECADITKLIMSSMDQSIDPCDNFYKYACGNFYNTTTIPDDRISVSSFEKLGDTFYMQMRQLSEEKSESDEPRHKTLFKKLYKSCMNTRGIEKRGLTTVHKLLRRVGGWPVLLNSWNEDDFKWTTTTYKLFQSQFYTNYLINIDIIIDSRNVSKKAIYLDVGELFFNKNLMAKGNKTEPAKAYYNYMVETAVAFGANRNKAMKELRQSLNFEIELAKIEVRHESESAFAQKNISTLDEDFPNIPWLDYLNAVMYPNHKVTSDDNIYFSGDKYFKYLDQTLQKTHKRVLANYLLTRAVLSLVPFLTESVRKNHLSYLKTYHGVTKYPPRWTSCVTTIAEHMQIAAGAMYVSKYRHTDSIKSVTKIYDNVKQEYVEFVRKNKFVSSNAKRKALENTKAMSCVVGYPDELLNDTKVNDVYKGLDFDESDFASSMLNLLMFKKQHEFKKLTENIDTVTWKELSEIALVNAFYYTGHKTLVIPATIMQGLQFNNNRPNYLNYGAIGVVIGHEYAHGFDDPSSQYKKRQLYFSNLWNIFTDNTKSIGKQKCFVKQYNAFVIPETGIKINGRKTSRENLADNAGVKCAYQAYRKWADRNGDEEVLPDLNLTPEQLFWLYNANIWCEKTRPEYLVNDQTEFEEHTPGMFRVLGSFSNSVDFARDFDCPKDSPMNPTNKCTMW